jgi:NAD+ kinase
MKGMEDSSTRPQRLIVVAKQDAGPLPGILSQLMPEFISRGWAIHADESIMGPWVAAGLPADLLKTTIPDKGDLGLALGGDGTMLRASRQFGFSGTPLLGINLGYLGFLTVHPAERAPAVLTKYFADRLVKESRRALHVSVVRGEEGSVSFDAMNDAVITKGALSRILALEVCIGGAPAARLRSDGLIVATPTGSTAYALSAGGPIVHPSLEAWTVAPICPHSLSMRPIVVPIGMTVKVALDQAGEANLTIDGQVVCPIRPGDEIEMRDAGRCATLLLDPDVPFFALLREKMHWNTQ